MDDATRNFVALVGVSATLAAYAVCGFVAYVLIPFLGLQPGALARIGLACLMPALVLLAVVGTSLGLAFRTLTLQLFASRQLRRWVEAQALPPLPRLVAAAHAAGLEGRVSMIGSAESFSFVYGIFIPRVAVSRGFVESLTAEGLRASLEHEHYHVRALDPLRALLGKTLSEAFFLLPSLEALRLRYEAARELAADHRAVQAVGPRPLLGALLKALENPGRGPVTSASLADPGFLEARIYHLETGRAPSLTVAGISSLVTSALGIGSFLFLFIAAVIGLGGTSALAGLADDELSAGGSVLGALCVVPLLAVVGLIYWRLSRRAGKPLTPKGAYEG